MTFLKWFVIAGAAAILAIYALYGMAIELLVKYSTPNREDEETK